MYIDTITVGFPMFLPIDYVSNWPRQRKDYGLETYGRIISFLGDHPISVIYHPTDKLGKPHPLLLFQLSLPRMVSDCNHELIYDQSQAIDKANMIISYVSEFSSVRIEDGRLSRIDPCYHHHVGDLWSDYLTILSLSNYPHRDTAPYSNCGVQYKSEEETAKFYYKYRLCKHPEIKEELRQETTIRGSDHIKELLGNKEPILTNIDDTFVKKILQKDLDRMRLNEKIICNRSQELEILMNKYGPTRANSLIGYMRLRESYSKEQLISKNILNRSAIRYRENLISEAGIAIHTNEKVSLPPLSIDI